MPSIVAFQLKQIFIRILSSLVCLQTTIDVENV